MNCNKCLKKSYCAYIHYFDHDTSLGCIEFVDIDSPTYISTPSLNIEENKNNEDYVVEYKGIAIYKTLKAFEIINEKDVDVAMFKSVLHADNNLHTASYYNSYFVATYRHLTQEDFNLLKEVLK